MDKTFQVEIENEYKTQIRELEENLIQIGEFEASVKPKIGLKMIYAVINYVVAIILVFLAFTIVLYVYVDELIPLIERVTSLKLLSFEELVINLKDVNISTIQLFLVLVAWLLVIVAYLLRSIRRKNMIIMDIGMITGDFKIRAIKMLDDSKDRLRNYNKLIADENRAFSNRN